MCCVEEVVRHFVEPLERALTGEIRLGIDVHLALPTIEQRVRFATHTPQRGLEVLGGLGDHLGRQDRALGLSQVRCRQDVAHRCREPVIAVCRSQQPVGPARDFPGAVEVLQHQPLVVRF